MKEQQVRPKRPLAVNLIILWLILAPIMNIAVLMYAVSQPIQSQIINETQTLDPNYYFYAGLDVQSESTNSVKLNAENLVNLYLLDKAELEKLRNGKTFQYYPEGSHLNVSYSEFQVDLPVGEWYFVVVNPHESKSVKVNLEVNYVKPVESYKNTTTTSPTYTPSWIGIIGLILYVSAINSLWKMQKNWLWYIYFVFGLGVVINVLSFYWWGIDLLNWIDWLAIGQSAINILCINWLYRNRNIFIEPPKEKSSLGTKSEWMRVGLIILGLFGIPILFAVIIPDYILYGILAIPLWIVFVWFFIPKLLKRRKK